MVGAAADRVIPAAKVYRKRMKGVQTRKTLDFIGLPSFRLHPSVRCSPEGCSGGVHAILNTGVHGGVQGCSRVQGKILPIEWTDEFNPIPVCGQIK